jgi:thioredoxin 1
MATLEVTADSFKAAVLDSEKPVLVDFWAEWCGPCRMIAPILEEISDEYGDKITIAKLDVDANPDIAMQYNITGIPLMGLFQGGEMVKQILGARPKAAILEELAGII